MSFLSRFKPPVLVLVTISLVGILASVLVTISFTGVVPDAIAEIKDRRKQFCETSAVAFSMMAQRSDTKTMEEYLTAIANRCGDVQSLGVRTVDGMLVVQINEHETKWIADEELDSQLWVDLYANGEVWGQFEAAFDPVGSNNWITRYANIDHLIVVSAVCAIAFYFYLRVVLRQLNPSNVIPHRVRDALDTLAEGLLVLDRDERIVLANRAFEEATGAERDSLLGNSVDKLPFVDRDDTVDQLAPWKTALVEGTRSRGRLLGVDNGTAGEVTFSVSASPIFDEKGRSRGALATFEDVTRLEDKKRELAGVVASLQTSTEEIKRQNRELERLASSDPLTGCLNRRSFFARFEHEWRLSQRHGHPTSAIMTDIDFFKSINDDHGHSAGDEVLRSVGNLLTGLARDTDIVCRYGGEEFSILLPHTTAADAEVVAERIRVAIADLEFDGFSITASLGVAEMTPETDSPQSLLDRADKCLYVAKRNGRNRVINANNVADEIEASEEALSREKPVEDMTAALPYQAVTALISALAYRDASTAAHCRRVADLCVTIGHGLLTLKQSYTLEVAALLHDVGKVGVPDHILLKPGKLTDEEWSVMRRHDEIGKQIIRASFASPELTEIVESYQKGFVVSPDSPQSLPIGARILAVADAYDSMTTPSVYRECCSQSEAFDELRRCAGSQFDPEIVERSIRSIRSSSSSRRQNEVSGSKELALAVGLQLETFSEALDEQNFEAIGAVAKRLEQTAVRYNAAPLHEIASKTARVVDEDAELITILEAANDLLHICRESQRAFLCNEPHSVTVA